MLARSRCERTFGQGLSNAETHPCEARQGSIVRHRRAEKEGGAACHEANRSRQGFNLHGNSVEKPGRRAVSPGSQPSPTCAEAESRAEQEGSRMPRLVAVALPMSSIDQTGLVYPAFRRI